MAGWRDDGDYWVDEATGMPLPKAWSPQPPSPPTDLAALVGVAPPPAGGALPGAAQAPGAFVPPMSARPAGPPPVDGALPGSPVAPDLDQRSAAFAQGIRPGAPPPPTPPPTGKPAGNGAPREPQENRPIADIAGAAADPYAMADASLGREGAAEAARADLRAKGLQDASVSNRVEVQKLAALQAKAAQAAKADFANLSEEYTQIDKDLPEEGLSTGQTVGFAIAAALQGALKPAGENSAITAMQHAIDSKAKSRAAEVSKRRALLGDKTAFAKDKVAQAQQELAAQDLIRAQEYDAALKQVDADVAQYDSPIAREKLMQTRAELMQRRDEARARAEQQLFDNHLNVAQFEEQQRAHKAGEAQGWRQIKNQEKQFEQNLVLKAAELEQQGNIAGAAAARQQAQTAIFGKDGAVIATAPDAETARQLRNGISAATKMSAALDELGALYEKSGGEVNALNSDDKQRMEALHGQLIMYSKDKDKLGALAGADLDLIYKNLGEDPTSFFSNQARWKETRALIEDGVNYDLTTLTGYKGPRWTAPVDTRIADMQKVGKAAEPIIESQERERMAQTMNGLGVSDQVIRGTKGADLEEEANARYRAEFEARRARLPEGMR